MRVHYTPCRQGHLAHIKPQPHDRALIPAYMSTGFARELEHSLSMTAWVGSTPIGAAGVIGAHGNTAIAWTLLGADAGPYMRELTRQVRYVLDTSPFKRIEMRVRCDFAPGHRWAKLLGFGEPEAPLMRCSGVNGEDETLYARVR